MNKFDVIIVGAGPAGISCALMLRNSGINVAVIEKSKFPRDKVCGDALSLDVLNQLAIISPDLLKDFEALDAKVPCPGVKIISPKGDELKLPFYVKGEKKHGYICERFTFDNFMFEELTKSKEITIFQQTRVIDVFFNKSDVSIETDNGTFSAKMVIGADGANSIVNKKVGLNPLSKEHYCVGLRQYFENVKGIHDDNFIELHFFEEILPSYLWIFPLPNGKANVGIGMLSSSICKKKINLKETFNHLIHEHPRLKHRFENAKPLESVKGWGLPLGSKKRKISGNHYLLLGDAASLIDPFSGDGIPNAIRSGRVASDVIKKAFQENDFSDKYLKQYDKELYSRIGLEFKISKQIQNLSKRVWLFNFIVKRVKQSKYLKNFMVESLGNINKKKIIAGPKFLYYLLFK